VSREGRDWADLQSALPSKGRVLAWHLGYFADDKGICFGLAQAKLVQRTGWAKGTLKRWTDLLRALDLVATRRRFNPRKQHHDALVYKLNLGRVVTAKEVKEALSRIAILRSHSGEPDRKNRGSRIATGGTLMKNPKKDVVAAGRRRPAATAQAGRVAPSETSSPIAEPARSLTPAGLAHGLANGREGHEHEARQGHEFDPPVRNGHDPSGIWQWTDHAGLVGEFGAEAVERWCAQLRKAVIGGDPELVDLVLSVAAAQASVTCIPAKKREFVYSLAVSAAAEAVSGQAGRDLKRFLSVRGW
jgi:hypothetical protein